MTISTEQRPQSLPSLEDLRRWLDQPSATIRDAAEKWGCKPNDLRDILGVPRRGPHRATRRPSAALLGPPLITRQLTSGCVEIERYLSSVLDQLELDQEAMRRDGSWQALVASQKAAVAIRRQIEEVKRQKDDAAWDPTDRDAVVREVLQLGPDILGDPAVVAAVSALAGH